MAIPLHGRVVIELHCFDRRYSYWAVRDTLDAHPKARKWISESTRLPHFIPREGNEEVFESRVGPLLGGRMNVLQLAARSGLLLSTLVLKLMLIRILRLLQR